MLTLALCSIHYRSLVRSFVRSVSAVMLGLCVLYAVSSSHNLVFYLHTNHVSCKRCIQQKTTRTDRKKTTKHTKQKGPSQTISSEMKRRRKKHSTSIAYGVRFFSLSSSCIFLGRIYDRVYINRTLHIPCRLQCYRESASVCALQYCCCCCFFSCDEWINYVYGTSAQSI